MAGGRIITVKAGALVRRVPVTVFPGPVFVLDADMRGL